jgi:peptidoglycan/xylan/chitin deacetylase (PgdA/CDA1 family)
MKGWLRGVAKRLFRTALRHLSGGAVISRLPRSAGAAVCLTFDDGPHHPNTARILRILRDEGVRATFFVQGAACERHPELVRAIVAEGHEVANHGYSHHGPNEVSAAEYVADVERGHRLIEEVVGHRIPRIFRPPYGRISARTFLALWRRGYGFVLWSTDSRDSYITEPDAVLANVFKCPLEPGAIVLLHEDYDWTVEALPALIRLTRSMGLRFTTLVSVRSFPMLRGAPESIDSVSRERCA